MKRIFTYISLLLFSVLSTISFGQLTVDQLIQEIETASAIPLAERLNIKNNGVASSILDEDDLLLATRSDQWDNSAWTGVDSLEFTYNNEGLAVEILTLNQSNNEWNNFNKVIQEYNANNNISHLMTFDWDGMEWDTATQTLYTYNANNNATNILFQNWDGMSWENTQQFFFEYDNDDNQILLQYQFWVAGDWLNYYQNISEYDVNNFIISEITQTYSTDWENASKSSWEYDANGNRTLFISQIWMANDWQNAFQSIYTFDANDNQILRLKQDWNGSSWYDDYRIINEYNAGNNLTYELRQDWDGFDWFNLYQEFYSYTDDVLDSIISQIWDENANDWENEFKDIFEFDEFNNQTYVLNQVWGGSDWDNDYQSFFYYQIITSNSNVNLFANSIKVFPNPNNGIFTLDLSSLELQNGTLNVYNSIGQLLSQQALSNRRNTINLNLSHFQKGTYFLQINDGMQHITRAIQILK